MKKLAHPNIINCLGLVSVDGSDGLVMEYCDKGNLIAYSRAHHN